MTDRNPPSDPLSTPSGEEFFRLPRLEDLLAEHGTRKGRVDGMVINDLLQSTDRFSMAVGDDRMAGAGIRSGDHVVVSREATPRDGDIIAVQIGERRLVRRYFNASRRIRLETAEADAPVMIVDERTPGVTILGRVVQVYHPL